VCVLRGQSFPGFSACSRFVSDFVALEIFYLEIFQKKNFLSLSKSFWTIVLANFTMSERPIFNLLFVFVFFPLFIFRKFWICSDKSSRLAISILW